MPLQYYRLLKFTGNSLWKLLEIPYVYLYAWVNRNKSEVVLLVNSAAEERMLLPLADGLANCFDKVHLIVNSYDVYKKYSLTKNKRIKSYFNNPLIIATFCVSKANKVLVCCLDHQYYFNAHQSGIYIVKCAQSFGVITCCLQHGGSMHDNLFGQSTSVSKFQLLWGEYSRRILVDNYSISNDSIRVVGNHLHDRVFTKYIANMTDDMSRFNKNSRINILLATCLHTEYDHYADSDELYKSYIANIYKIFSGIEGIIHIKPHPADKDVAYEHYRTMPKNMTCEVVMHNKYDDIYELLIQAQLVVTRASTVAEEAVILGKTVILYDLFENGPSQCLQHLKHYSNVHFLYGYDIDKLISKVNEIVNGARELPLIKLQENGIREFTFKLDGDSAARTISALYEIMHNSRHNKFMAIEPSGF